MRSACSAVTLRMMVQQSMLAVPKGEQRVFDTRTACFAIASVPRGTGLIRSAFGLHVARKTHAWWSCCQAALPSLRASWCTCSQSAASKLGCMRHRGGPLLDSRHLVLTAPQTPPLNGAILTCVE